MAPNYDTNSNERGMLGQRKNWANSLNNWLKRKRPLFLACANCSRRWHIFAFVFFQPTLYYLLVQPGDFVNGIVHARKIHEAGSDAAIVPDNG